MVACEKPWMRRGTAPALAIALGLALTAAAQAQFLQPTPPQDNAANSAAAMKDTVHDPRIDHSQTGRGQWGMWDIGRPHPMQGKGEFGDHDAIGIAAGKLIPTDCALYWTDPDTHRILCFASQASLVYFLAAPKANEARAQRRWHDMKKTPSG